MRLKEQYEIMRQGNFYLGARPVSFKTRYAGYRRIAGLGARLHKHGRLLADGLFSAGGLRARGNSSVFLQLTILLYARLQRQRLRNLSYGLARLWCMRLVPVEPWAWNILRYLRVRTYRGHRYRRGLSAHGGRTHTNTKTTRRVADPAAKVVRLARWANYLWQPRRRPPLAPRSKVKTASKRALKAVRYKRGVVRVKKKKDIWA